MRLSGWGRYPQADCAVLDAEPGADLPALMSTCTSLIARGAGRAYGDAAINPAATLRLGKLNRLLAFDPQTGRLTCEAGALLADIIAVFAPRGWFAPVTPGTKFVTVGGMIAADVHGKNHHKDGGFGAFVDSLDLLAADGAIVRCSRTENAALFNATLGGMGLTGVILAATFKLRPIETDLIRQITLRAPNLDSVLEQFEAAQDRTYSVAWIDCMAAGPHLGRSLLYLGEHARADELPSGSPRFRPARAKRLGVPIDLPNWTLNGLSIRAFNAVYWAAGRPGEALVGIDPYFYPLDGVAGWNRIYGPRGFVQYQCVLPLAGAREGLKDMLARVARRGAGSFLAVLKRLGPQGEGLLSFPMEGYTLAMDFPASGGNLALLDELDAVAEAFGGRCYLAKDARAPARMVQRGYPRLADFAALRTRTGARQRFNSLQSERLEL